MHVVEMPAERTTQVALTDNDVMLIHRALYYGEHSDTRREAEMRALHQKFDGLRKSLKLHVYI